MAIADPDFDTLAHVRTLREAGVEQKQAEAHAEAGRAIRAGLATKADLAVIEADIAAIKARLDTFATKADLDKFATKADLDRFATKADLDRFATKADLYRVLWMQTGVFVAATTALIAAFKLFG